MSPRVRFHDDHSRPHGGGALMVTAAALAAAALSVLMRLLVQAA